ncbi:MAG: glutamate 5-kinase [Acinetobacter sp.]
MGLRDELQADLAEAFDHDLFDAVYRFSCKRIIETDYDPIQNVSTTATLTYDGRGALFGSYSQYEVMKLGVLASDNKATLLQNEVTNEPKINDEWVTVKGTYRVVHIQQDSVQATWTIQLRKV